ncbi:GNAT family N-acetyltransferase [Streptomyces roseus]|uniref:Acetyltransferase n=1 Tax=Streptomyces roseus TaxID=66430 RepID=A0A0J6XUZ1_9ACTN|nr:GNAT family protein [Streptomyces roseus]KMO98518.1 acetyltransferase [Streptomyces roseus]
MDLLTSERLTLVPLDEERALAVLRGVPGSGCRWGDGYPGEGDRAGARRFLRVLAESGDPAPFGAYEIRRRRDGLTIGGAGFHGPADAAGVVTVGYGLVPAARGHGYAAEALRALLGHARAHGASGAAGDADRENTASHRVMAAAGMRLVGEDERLRYYAVTWAGAAQAASS